MPPESPPSLHQSGEKIRFENGFDELPTEVEATDLMTATMDLAIATFLSLLWPKQAGIREELAMAAGGVLYRGKLPSERAAKIVFHATNLAGDEESKKREQAVRDTYAKADKGEAITGIPTFITLMGTDGKQLIGYLQRWLGIENWTKPERKPADFYFQNIGNLINGEAGQREAIVGDWLMTGSITLLFAPPKCFKTWVCMALNDALVRAVKFLDFNVPKKRRILHVDGEMSNGELNERLQKIVVDNSNNLSLLTADTLYRNDEKPINICDRNDQEWIEKSLVVKKIEVLILDNLGSLSFGRDENDNSAPELESLLQWLMRLRYKGIAAILVHHSGHSGTNPRGASRLMAAVDTIIKIGVGDSEKDTFRFSFHRTRGPCPQPDSFHVQLKDGGDLMTLERLNHFSSEWKVETLKYINEFSPKTQKELVEPLGVKKGAIRKLPF